MGHGDNDAEKGPSKALACCAERMQTSVKHTQDYYVLNEFTLTTHDDLLGRQPTPTRDDEVDSCPHSTREVPEGDGVGSQTRDVSVTTIVTWVLTR